MELGLTSLARLDHSRTRPAISLNLVLRNGERRQIGSFGRPGEPTARAPGFTTNQVGPSRRFGNGRRSCSSRKSGSKGDGGLDSFRSVFSCVPGPPLGLAHAGNVGSSIPLLTNVDSVMSKTREGGAIASPYHQNARSRTRHIAGAPS